jgi:hypothetical protein
VREVTMGLDKHHTVPWPVFPRRPRRPDALGARHPVRYSRRLLIFRELVANEFPALELLDNLLVPIDSIIPTITARSQHARCNLAPSTMAPF